MSGRYTSALAMRPRTVEAAALGADCRAEARGPLSDLVGREGSDRSSSIQPNLRAICDHEITTPHVRIVLLLALAVVFHTKKSE